MKPTLILVTFITLLTRGVFAATLDTLTVVLDGSSNLLSWVQPQDQAYGRVIKLSADFIKARMSGPTDPGNGLPVIYICADYNPTNFLAGGSPNNPAGKNVTLADSMMLYCAYSGYAASPAGPWLSSINDVEQQRQFLDCLTSQTITARDQTPLNQATNRFLRLKVSQP